MCQSQSRCVPYVIDCLRYVAMIDCLRLFGLGALSTSISSLIGEFALIYGAFHHISSGITHLIPTPKMEDTIFSTNTISGTNIDITVVATTRT